MRRWPTLLLATVAALAAVALVGCAEVNPGGPAVPVTPAASSPTASGAPRADCVKALPGTVVMVDTQPVQLIGASSRAVVVSNQSGGDLCRWMPLATALHARGFEIALYNDIGAPDQNAGAILRYLRAHGVAHVALFGGSQGAKASIIAAAAATPQPDALVALSAEGFLQGVDVSDSAAKLHCPTLYVTAEHDPFGSYDANEEFQKVTPTGVSTLIVIPGADHGIQMLGDGDIQKHVLDFLDAHVAR